MEGFCGHETKMRQEVDLAKRGERFWTINRKGLWRVLFTEPLNIGGIVGTVVGLLLLGLAVVSGLTLYYSPAFWWKGKIPLSSRA